LTAAADRFENQLNLRNLREQDLRLGEVSEDITSSLFGLPEQIAGTTRESLLTESQRGQLLQSKAQPLQESLAQISSARARLSPRLSAAEQQLGLRLGLQQAELDRERQADVRRLTEAQLGANPADFVAFELFKRSLQEQGFTPTTGEARSDIEIQDLFQTALDLEGEGVSVGTGQFGVDIPSTGAISRSQLRGFSPTDVGILSSFLRGGVDIDEGPETQLAGINPEDFFTELEEGFVPTLPQQRTQFRF
ncbi:hypothetical protein LCGC14_2777390, partial [marine sediment metagenome]